MSRIFTFLFLTSITYCLAIDSSAQSLDEIIALGLPVVEITTVDHEEPTCEFVTHPEGSWGEGITNATKVPGSVKVYDVAGTIIYDSGEYESGESGMTIKIRGNTSAYGAKKPYKIKLQKKGDLLGRGDKNYNDKNWNLINDTQLKNHIGYEVSRLIEQDWTPASQFVNVIFNDEYRGLYTLVEAVERNDKCRIDVSETGFVAEHDPYWWNENGEYVKSLDNPTLNFTFKYPDYEDFTEEGLAYVTQALNDYERSAVNGNYDEYIDVESFAKWILAHDIMGTVDGGGSNFFISKYDNTPNSLIKAGPLWDFDATEGTPDKYCSTHYMRRFSVLFSSSNALFTEKYSELWFAYGNKVFTGVQQLIDSFLDEETWHSYNQSQIADSKVWNCNPDNTEQFYNRAIKWYPARKEWMQAQLGRLPEIEEPDNNEDDSVGIVLDIRDIFHIVPNGVVPKQSGIAFRVYTIDGKLIVNTISKDGEAIEISSPGLYILKAGGASHKIMIK